MKTIVENKEEYRVVHKVLEAEDVVTLKLLGKNDKIHTYTPGQFITVYFPQSGTPEGKSYSISSIPTEQTLNITVKAMGEFSNRLCSLKLDDKVTISPPYGFFFSESSDSNMIIFAAGIGVAPFRSMISNMLSINPQARISLHLSNKSIGGIIFRSEFERLEKKHPNFKLTNYITRERNIPSSMINSRININSIMEKTPHVDLNEYFICGSISFVRDIWKDLRKVGVPEDLIFTEAFFSH